MSSKRQSRIVDMWSMIEKYSTGYPTHYRAADISTGDSMSPLDTVLVVGTRGGLGSNILVLLLESRAVRRVYSLNRVRLDGKTRQERQADEFALQGLNSLLAFSSKLTLLEGDTAHPTLGLDSAVFEEVSLSITAVVLNGWLVEFTPPLSAFEPLIAGVRNLIDICLRSPRVLQPHIIFCSSLTILQGLTRPASRPEIFLPGPSSLVEQGYAESKWVVEKLIETALRQTPLHATVARIGQVCGSPNGFWKTGEWFPMMLKSSQFMGYLPEDDRDITWIPARLAAISVIELLGSKIPIAHIAHPNPVSGTLVMASIAKDLSLSLIPRSEWLHRLETTITTSQTKDERKKNPASRLMPMMRHIMSSPKRDGFAAFEMPVVSTEIATLASTTLRNAPPICREDVSRWLECWQKAKFLDRPVNARL